VVLGAPIYSGRWHRDAHRFLRRHRTTSRWSPLPCSPWDHALATKRAGNVHVPSLIEPWQSGWLAYVAVALFGGVDPPKERHGERRDLRDWEAIRAWATGLPAFARPPGWSIR